MVGVSAMRSVCLAVASSGLTLALRRHLFLNTLMHLLTPTPRVATAALAMKASPAAAGDTSTLSAVNTLPNTGKTTLVPTLVTNS